MIEAKKVLCVIPARAGSKRVVNKNFKNFCGEPLIKWTVDAAKNCSIIDKVFVSTDSLEISDYCEGLGAIAKPLRNTELATDHSTTVDVLKDICTKDIDSHYVILLQPTSPLRNTTHIEKAFKSFLKSKKNSLVSVTKSDVPPTWLGKIENGASEILKSMTFARTQDLGDYYHLNGAIYIFEKDRFLTSGEILDKESVDAFVMDKVSSMDIDTEEDFFIAEAVAKSVLD